MIPVRFVTGVAAAMVLASCAHDSSHSAARGERASVNSYSTTTTSDRIIETGPSSPSVIDNKTTSPVTGSVTGSIQPSPSAMGTTTTSDSAQQQGGTPRQPPSSGIPDTTAR
jgi:hypothetical protein